MRSFFLSLIFLTLCATSLTYAHVIGDDSRKVAPEFPVSAGYYNSQYQADIALDNLSHISCPVGEDLSKNTTSGFFVDVEDFARSNNMTGSFSSCNNKILVTVAHYFENKGGRDSANCRVIKSFNSSVGTTAEYGKVEKIHVGDGYPAKSQDFAFVKIDDLKYGDNPNFQTLKICSEATSIKSISGMKCDAFYQDNIIMPHLAAYKIDENAIKKNSTLKYKAKLTSGQCCISGKSPTLKLLKHTCDMDGRSSGSPLLSIIGTGEPCVLGIQRSHTDLEVTPDLKENYLVSVMNPGFKDQFKKFIQANCSVNHP